LQMANRYVRTYSTSLIIREIHIKTTVRFHPTPIRIAIIKRTRNNKAWQGCGRKRTLVHCWWEWKLVQPLWKTVLRSLKKLKTERPYDSAIPHLSEENENTNSKRSIQPMF
ncbi:LORF2 protein, partial [Crocuta crocuta]